MSIATNTAIAPTTSPHTAHTGESHDSSVVRSVATTSELPMTTAPITHQLTRRGDGPVIRDDNLLHDHHVVATNKGTAHMHPQYRSGIHIIHGRRSARQ